MRCASTCLLVRPSVRASACTRSLLGKSSAEPDAAFASIGDPLSVTDVSLNPRARHCRRPRGGLSCVPVLCGPVLYGLRAPGVPLSGLRRLRSCWVMRSVMLSTPCAAAWAARRVCSRRRWGKRSAERVLCGLPPWATISTAVSDAERHRRHHEQSVFAITKQVSHTVRRIPQTMR
ncbi:Uncharacterised protein [Mycobacteroides abscessus subsp. abscessus]|nr:Uncharacterised protein [Mycobacteroides abscessus subsp. abscessus]